MEGVPPGQRSTTGARARRCGVLGPVAGAASVQRVKWELPQGSLEREAGTHHWGV